MASAPGPHDPLVEAAFDFDGPGRKLVLALKYGNDRSAVAAVARAMARRVVPGTVDLVTWAPTSSSRRRARGFDQAAVLAAAVARSLSLPCRCLLVRTGSRPQTGRTRDERLRGPVFRARRVIGARVLLVDDVVTTGATLRAAAAALRDGGAVEVRALVAARTPSEHRTAGRPAAPAEPSPVHWLPS